MEIIRFITEINIKLKKDN